MSILTLGLDRGATPCVMVHGAMRTGRWDWWPIAVRLARHRKVFLVDLPGHGSDRSPAPSDFDAMRRHLVRVIQDLRRPVHLIGHSNGGSLALATLPFLPNQVVTAVVQGANASVSSELAAFASGIDAGEVKRDPEVVRRYERIHGDWESLVAATRVWTLGGPNLSIADLARIETPVLVIEGGNDELNVRLGHGAHIARNLPRAELWQPDAGHDVHREAPVEWMRRVEEFLVRNDQDDLLDEILTTTVPVSMTADPNSLSEQVSQVLPGEAVTVSDENGAWAKIRHVEDGYTGWVPMSALVSSEGLTAEGRWYVVGPPLGGVWEGGIDTYPVGTAFRPTGEEGWWSLGTGTRVPIPDEYLVSGSGRNPAQVLSTIRRLTGTPYTWGGRTERGIDCSALAQLYWRLSGVQLPRDSWEQFESTYSPGGSPQVGDLAFFANPDSDPREKVSHVAICAGPNRIIHAFGPAESVVVDDLEDLLGRPRAPRFVSWGRPVTL